MSSNISSFAPPPINRYRSSRTSHQSSFWYTLPASTRTGLVALSFLVLMLPIASFGLSQTINLQPKAAPPEPPPTEIASPSASPLTP